MLGRYENFPEIRHGIVYFVHQLPTIELQQIMIKALYRLSRRQRGHKFSSVKSVLNCSVRFEFGIADGLTFNYIDEEVLKLSLDFVSRGVCSTLDFICIVRYYKKIGRRKYRPLRFDYYIIRFLFYERGGNIEVYHEKGTRRFPIDDLVALIIRRVNRELARSKQPRVTVMHE